MLLSGNEIEKNLGNGIIIEPFNEDQLNPNSYNLRLADELLLYNEVVLDMKRENRVRRIKIPEEGLVLEAGRLYLGRTVERTEVRDFVPKIIGRSSVGRLGLFVHVSAGFGDVGFNGYWTLNLVAVHPIRIYPNVPICQVYFEEVKGEYTLYDSSKYQGNAGIVASQLYKDFNRGKENGI